MATSCLNGTAGVQPGGSARSTCAVRRRRSKAGSHGSAPAAVGPGELHQREGLRFVAGEDVVLDQRREHRRAGRHVDRQEGAGLAAVEQADERGADREVRAAGERVGDEVEQAPAGHRRQADHADLREAEPLLEPDREGVAREGRLDVLAGGDGVDRPALPLEHELDLVPVAHVPIGEDVVVAHRPSLAGRAVSPLDRPVNRVARHGSQRHLSDRHRWGLGPR